MENVQSQSLLTEQALAKHIQVSLAALRRWRIEGRGPKYLKLGALVRYRPEDVARWLASVPAKGGKV
jgi:predicted DNA-binding transcriptional regulator AlpA